MTPVKPTIMQQHRQTHPQPALHRILHVWNLDEADQNLLSGYTMRTMYANQMIEQLKSHKGMLKLNGEYYSPIYQNCSRFQIGREANTTKPDMYRYAVSFRIYRDQHLALVQPMYPE